MKINISLSQKQNIKKGIDQIQCQRGVRDYFIKNLQNQLVFCLNDSETRLDKFQLKKARNYCYQDKQIQIMPNNEKSLELLKKYGYDLTEEFKKTKSKVINVNKYLFVDIENKNIKTWLEFMFECRMQFSYFIDSVTSETYKKNKFDIKIEDTNTILELNFESEKKPIKTNAQRMKRAKNKKKL